MQEAVYKVFKVENGWLLSEGGSFGKSWICPTAHNIGEIIHEQSGKKQQLADLQKQAGG